MLESERKSPEEAPSMMSKEPSSALSNRLNINKSSFSNTKNSGTFFKSRSQRHLRNTSIKEITKSQYHGVAEDNVKHINMKSIQNKKNETLYGRKIPALLSTMDIFGADKSNTQRVELENNSKLQYRSDSKKEVHHMHHGMSDAVLPILGYNFMAPPSKSATKIPIIKRIGQQPKQKFSEKKQEISVFKKKTMTVNKDLYNEGQIFLANDPFKEENKNVRSMKKYL